jgi:hypothetical protein
LVLSEKLASLLLHLAPGEIPALIASSAIARPFALLKEITELSAGLRVHSKLLGDGLDVSNVPLFAHVNIL